MIAREGVATEKGLRGWLLRRVWPQRKVWLPRWAWTLRVEAIKEGVIAGEGVDSEGA